MAYTNIDDLLNKVENEGMNEQGRLGANEFNRLVQAVKECQGSAKSVKFGGLDPVSPNDDGVVIIPMISDSWTGSLRLQRKVIQDYEEVYVAVADDGSYLYKDTDVPVRFQFREYRLRTNDDTGETEYQPSNKEVTVKILKPTLTGRQELYSFTYTAKAFASTEWLELNLQPYLSAGDNNLIFEVSNTSSGETPSVSFTIQAANLNLRVADDNNWNNTALVVGMDTSLTVEYYANGAVDRTLCVKFTGASGTTSTHRIFVPKATASTTVTSETFTATEDTVSFFSEGLKKVEAWIEAGEGDDIVTSNVVVNNIIAVQSGSTNKYVAIQGCIESMLNFEAATMFGYNIYTPEPPATVTFVIADSTKTNVYLEVPIANRAVNTLYEFASVLSIQSSLPSIHVYVFAKIDGTYVNSGNSLADFLVDNSEDFGAVEGADFYLNPMLRSNQEENPMRIINAMDNTVVTADPSNFQNISFQPGVDGWVEQNNIRFLRLLAGSTLTIPYDIYSQFTDNSRHGLTVEIDFAVRNITNEEDPILTIGNRNASNPKGVYMKALNGAFMNRSNTSWDSADVSWQEGVRTRLVFNFQHNYNLVSPESGRGRAASATIAIIRAYINGVINREVRVADVSNANEINAGGNIVIGQSGCDIDIYGIRVYKKNLTPEQVVKNYISTLPTVAEKKEVYDDNDILDNGVVSFEKALAAGYNCIVWHGTHLSRRYKDNPKRYGYYEIYRHNADGTLDRAHSGTQYGVEGSGQGTTAMTYADWNYSFKEDKKTGSGHDEYKYDVNGTLKNVFVDLDGVVAFGAAENKQKFGYQLKSGIPVAKKLVGKINYASPMQSHKMGACNLYNDLYARCVAGYGESGYSFDQTDCITDFSSGQRVTVIEEPFLYFVQEVEGADNALKVFKGLSTFGPGKADKPTWGVTDASLLAGDSLVEGALNNNPLTDMRVPFVDTIDSATGRYVCEYQISNDQGDKVEAFVYAGAKNINWGFGDTLELHSGNASAVWPGVREGDQTNADAPTTKQVKLWQPIFNFLYLMNTKIAPWKGPNGDGQNAKLSQLNIAVLSNSFDSSVAYWMIDSDAGEGYAKFDLFRCHYKADGTRQYVPAGIHLVQGQLTFENFACLYDLTASPTGVTAYSESDLWYDVSNPANDTRNITLNLQTELNAVKNKNGLTDVINYSADVDAVNTAMKKFICKIFRLYVDSNVYLNKKSVQFHHETMVLWAGTDNRSKNTYYRLNPYAVQTLNNTDHNWPNMEMNDDDLDTIFKTNNSGIQSKPYWVLEHDADPVTGYHWEGQDNVLNNTLNDAYGYGFLETGDKQLELSNMMGRIFNAMVALANGQTMPDGTAVSADPIGCFDFYFFYIQKYFPAVAYNETARIRYEIPAVLYRSQAADDGGEDYPQDPISQSLGDQYDSEKEYIRKRVTMLAGYAGYRMSQFGFRGYAGSYAVALKPHQYIYPMHEVGDQRSSSPVRSMTRVAPGTTFNLSFDNNSATNGVYFYFIGSMREIGNIASWGNGTYSGEAETTAMAPNAARLVRFDMYSADAEGVVFNPRAGAFNLAACQNLEHIDVHNAYRLSGLDGLTNLVRLQDIDCRGTALTTLGLPSTPALTSMKLPATFEELNVQDCPNLATLQFDGYENLESFVIGGSTQVNTKEILMGVYGYNITQEANVIQTISLDGIAWTGINWTFLNWLLSVNTLTLTGRIHMVRNSSGQITFALKKKLIEKFGNVDSESNSLYIDYESNTLGSVQVTGDGYFDSVGEVKHYDLIPNVASGNTIKSYAWTISGGSSGIDPDDYAEVDALGNVTCKQMGVESGGSGPTVTLQCVVTLTNGNTLPAVTMDIRCYFRQAKLGDYVYHDGTWDDRLNVAKSVIGICFYCKKVVVDGGAGDWYDRRMFACANVNSRPWGLYPNGDSKGTNGFASRGANALKYMLNGVATDPWDVPLLSNITSAGASYTTYADMIDTNNLDPGFPENDPQRYFKQYSNSTAVGRFNLVEMGQSIKSDVFGSDNMYTAESMVPQGLYDTACIIRHRNNVLSGTTYDNGTPSNPDDDTNYTYFKPSDDSRGNLSDKMLAIKNFAANTIGDTYTDIYMQYLYPAASECFAYEPSVSSDNALADKFKCHHWYLPSIGELARLCFLSMTCYSGSSIYEASAAALFGDIFANAVTAGKFTRMSASYYWSSTEYNSVNAWAVNFSSGGIYDYHGKYNTYVVRPVAAF